MDCAWVYVPGGGGGYSPQILVGMCRVKMRVSRTSLSRFELENATLRNCQDAVWRWRSGRLLRPLSHCTNLNKKCAEHGILILLRDFLNNFLALLGTSWRFLIDSGRPIFLKKFANMLKKIIDYFTCLVTSWRRLGPSWRCLSHFLMTSWCLLDDFLQMAYYKWHIMIFSSFRNYLGGGGGTKRYICQPNIFIGGDWPPGSTPLVDR